MLSGESRYTRAFQGAVQHAEMWTLSGYQSGRRHFSIWLLKHLTQLVLGYLARHWAMGNRSIPMSL